MKGTWLLKDYDSPGGREFWVRAYKGWPESWYLGELRRDYGRAVRRNQDLDLTWVLSGPFATLVLRDLGPELNLADGHSNQSRN
jgi:hypothetical protein